MAIWSDRTKKDKINDDLLGFSKNNHENDHPIEFQSKTSVHEKNVHSQFSIMPRNEPRLGGYYAGKHSK